MTDEGEAGRGRRAPPAPPPRQAPRPPEPRPRTTLPEAVPHPKEPTYDVVPRLIRPSEHLAMVQRRPVPLTPAVTVLPPPKAPPALAPAMRGPGLRVVRMPPPRTELQPPPIVHLPGLAAPAPPAPPASAPRTIVIHRPDARHGFGFTLRHLVVYPPDSVQELYEDARHLAVGAVGAPMDTIFVRSVRAGGPAAAAGLRAGDRVLAVNGEPVACGRTRAPYARVVQLAQREPTSLRLTVVPRDHDLLQRYFSEAAYNPETNQKQIDMPASISEHESRLFDAHRRPRAPGPVASPATGAVSPRQKEDPEYATVPSLPPPRFDMSRLVTSPHYLLHDRRESDTSLPSSATESKDSLGSFDSSSTLTGREFDDSIILSRIRKSLEQKEAFLRRPSQPTGWATEPPAIKQKEFYARPQKLPQTSWPPSPPPIQQKQDKDEDKDCGTSVDSGTYSGYGELNGTSDKVKPKQEKSQFVSTLTKIQESTVQTNGVTNGNADGKDDSASSSSQDTRYPIPELQLVTARTKQLEEARGVGSLRMETARSELARMSNAKLEPSVALRRRDFEAKASRREARSLDVQNNAELESAATAAAAAAGEGLSGNQLTITGSKHLHCPPPEGYTPETEKVQMRTRSNSAGSEGLSIRRHHTSDARQAARRMGLNCEQLEELARGAGAARPSRLPLPSPAASGPATPTTPSDSGFADDPVIRRQKKEAQLGEEERAMRRVSYLKATWGDRLHLESDAEPEGDNHALRTAHRKWRPPRFTDDITPLLRIFDPNATIPARADKKSEGGDSTETVTSEGDVEGNVQVKMVVSNGKRASDRSWKQVWAALHGTKLHLYRHHGSQSPGATGSAGPAGAETASRDSLDVRYSLAALADDYTKRKHVLRVTTAEGAELLLQADGAADAQRWLAALRAHAAEPPPASPAPPASPSPPATTTEDCPSPLPPQRNKKPVRNSSPTGPTTPTLPSSPKNKTWKGRMAKQLRRMHGGGTAPAPAAGWLGVPLERLPPDPDHAPVPLAVTLPAQAIEEHGLRTVGVYRVPGNAAGVAALAAALERGAPPARGDARWADVHVASSLLKAFLRRLPDPLLTALLYPHFIAADRSRERAHALRRLVLALPVAHRATLRYLVRHLRRVAAHASCNKMEARNLAIVFGPTLVRGSSDDMLAMVNDMASQCRIIESFLTHYEWYFEDGATAPREPPPAADELSPAPAPSRDLLIHNVKKIEGKDVSTRDIVSSIISAANRKMQRKPRKDSKKASPPPEPPLAPLAPLDPLDPQPPLSDSEAAPQSPATRGHREISRLHNFSIDGVGDLVSSLTSTFDQKLRSLHAADDIPYADDAPVAWGGTRGALRRCESLAPAPRVAKLKRKNGMPARGIKRRHTVGGTQDLERDAAAAPRTRASSPDLPAALAPRSPLALRSPLESHV